MFCQLEVLQHCLPQSIRRTLNELPKSLDETYERVLKEIGMANRDYAHRLSQCLTVAIRPLRVEELAEILALDFEEVEGGSPRLNEDWRWEDQQRAVLSTCSSLITLVDNGGSRVIQFSHFSVKEFLTSDRLVTSKRDVSYFHIIPELAHTTLAQACLGILLQLDGGSNKGSSPLARYASRHWVEHARFGMVSSRIEDGMRRLFRSANPSFAAWLQLHDIDEHWVQFTRYKIAHRGSPLYYASLCGFHELAAHIIVEHPEQVHARGGLNHSPLVAALHKGHFNVAELLHQHGAALDVTCSDNRTPLQAASADGLIDVARWLLEHGADTEVKNKYYSTPLHLASSSGRLGIIRLLLDHFAEIEAENTDGRTPLHLASAFGGAEIARLLLDRGANANAANKDGWTLLHLASYEGQTETARLLLDRGANPDAKSKGGLAPLHLASRAEVVHVLLDCGANAAAEDKEEWTPLHEASSEGRTEIVRLLLDRGASADAKDKVGRTPAQVASGKGKNEILRMLA